MEVRRLASCLMAAASLSIVGQASGAAPIELVYLRSGKAEVCPEQATLEKAVGKRLGYHPFFPVAERKLVAEISSKGNVLHARATLVDKGGVVRGNRQLSAPVGECGELIDSLALAISITLDPMSVATSSGGAPPASDSTPRSVDSAARVSSETSEGATGPTQPSRSEVDPGRTPPAEPSSPDSDVRTPAATQASPGVPLELIASLGISGQVGALPRPIPAVQGAIEVRRGRGALALEVTGTPVVPQSGPAGSTADLSLLYGSVVPCFWAGRLGACAVLSLGRMHGAGSQVEQPREESRFHAAAGLRIIGLVPIAGPLAIRAHVGGGATLTRPSFDLVGSEVWRPPPLSAEAALALAWQFY